MRSMLSLALFCSALASFTLFTGCGPKAGDNKKPDAHGHDHDHDHALGPHGGHALELGEEEYHAEWTHDDASGKVAVFILDKAMKKEVPIEAESLTITTKIGDKPETVYKLEAMNPTEGKTAHFELTDKALATALIAVGDKATAKLNVKIGDKTYEQKFEKHEDHHH